MRWGIAPRAALPPAKFAQLKTAQPRARNLANFAGWKGGRFRRGQLVSHEVGVSQGSADPRPQLCTLRPPEQGAPSVGSWRRSAHQGAALLPAQFAQFKGPRPQLREPRELGGGRSRRGLLEGVTLQHGAMLYPAKLAQSRLAKPRVRNFVNFTG